MTDNSGDDEIVAPAVWGVTEGAVRTTEIGLTFLPVDQVVHVGQEFMVEVRFLNDGRTALFAFTSRSSLVDGCGEAQPWAAVRRGALEEVQQRSGVDIVFWDTALPSSLWRTGEDGDTTETSDF
jgi:hypothetical protein